MTEHTYPIWHPFTQMKTAGDPLPVKRAHGAILELTDGRKVIDCISSWWVTLHGHSNEQIAQAIYEQAKELEHVIFAGFTHEPALKLVRSVMQKLPPSLTRVFFSDNGSTSVEVALKMAVQYWRNIGQADRTLFIGFEHGYHGDTFGAMSAGGSSDFWDAFRPLMFPIQTVPFPETWDDDTEVEAKETASLQALRKLLDEHHLRCAAIITEPLVQGAAGMRMCRPEFLQKLRNIADEFGVLLIFDEVMTGFGRLGDWFACTKSQTEPDIICLSKGLTGGTLPLSLTLCRERIYEAFLADDLNKALFHSHSYTGNPIACAAGIASWKLLLEAEGTFRSFESRHRTIMANSALQRMNRIRFCGTIAAFDLPVEANYFSDLAPKLRKQFLAKGLLLRPLGSTIYLMPPLCVDDDMLAHIYATVEEVVSNVAAPTLLC